MNLMDADGWDYTITGDGLDWKVSWAAMLGLRLEATVSFREVEYHPTEAERGEAWGAPYTHRTEPWVEFHGPAMSEVTVVGDAHGALHLGQALKDAVIAKVKAHVTEALIDERDKK